MRKALEGGGFSFNGLADFPRGACGTTADMLGQYFQELGLGEWNYRQGLLPDSGNTHGWIERKGLLVDITADQFPDVKQSVIVTAHSPWHARLNPIVGYLTANLGHYDDIDDDIRDEILGDYALAKARADQLAPS